MDFIKKNTVLVVSLLVALIVSLILGVFTKKEHDEMVKSSKEFNEEKAKIKALNEADLHPVSGNVEAIKADVKKMKQIVEKINLKFGVPFRKALVAFSKKLGMSEMEFRSAFKKFYKVEARKQKAKKVRKEDIGISVLASFFKKNKISDAKRDAAIEAFVNLAKLETTESFREMSSEDVYPVILEALGYDRWMTSNDCADYIFNMNEALKKRLNGHVALDDSVKKFTFGEFTEHPPVPEDVPYIIKLSRMIENFVLLAKEAKVKAIVGLRREGGLSGEKHGDFLVYEFSATLQGDVNVLRNFINKVQAAYKNNRIYVLRDVKFERLQDVVGQSTSPSNNRRRRAVRRVVRRRTRVVKEKSEEEELAPKKYWEKEGYGQAVIGGDNTCRVKLKYDYYIYIGK